MAPKIEPKKDEFIPLVASMNRGVKIYDFKTVNIVQKEDVTIPTKIFTDQSIATNT